MLCVCVFFVNGKWFENPLHDVWESNIANVNLLKSIPHDTTWYNMSYVGVSDFKQEMNVHDFDNFDNLQVWRHRGNRTWSPAAPWERGNHGTWQQMLLLGLERRHWRLKHRVFKERPKGLLEWTCTSWRCKTVTTWHIKGRCSLDVFKVWICCTSITSH